MKIALIAALSGALLAVGAQALPSAIGSSDDTTDALVNPAASRTTEDAGVRREDRREDRSEDRRDDTTTTSTTPTTTAPTTTAPAGRPEDNGVAGDVSGPCDEAEHANDPRCTGGVVRDDDRGGDDRGRDDDGGDRHGGDDDNSGPGSDSSGHGSGGDDDGDDHSGSGHGGGDDD